MTNKKRTIKVNKGDGWINIANNNNINLNDLLYWNGVDPLSKESLPIVHPNQEVYVADPYKLDAARVTAEAPEDYVDFGNKGQKIINNYAIAVKQGAISLNDVPEVYRTATFQKMITNSTDKAADRILQMGLNTALFLADPVGYSLGYAGQKAAAYANDQLSGRNEYDIGDVFNYTPVRGTEYASKHPVSSLLTDIATGAVVGGVVRNAGTIARNARQVAQNAAATAGMGREILAYPVAGRSNFGSVFQSGTNGAGKTGTAISGGLKSGGYRFNVSSKGLFNHAASGNATINWVKPDATLPIQPIPLKPAIGPIHWLNTDPSVTIVHPAERHIYEQQSFNNWQQPMKEGWVVGDFKPGTGVFSITGETPKGNTVNDQALTQESLQILPGDYAPRVAKYIPGTISGTPSSIFSGLGIEYNSSNPGNLIVK